MPGFRPVVPKLTDPELIGGPDRPPLEQEPERQLDKPVKSNMISNMTLIASSVVLTVIVILIVWQIYKMLKEDDKPLHPRAGFHPGTGINSGAGISSGGGINSGAGMHSGAAMHSGTAMHSGYSKEAEAEIRKYKQSNDDKMLEQNRAKPHLKPAMKTSTKLASEVNSFDIVEVTDELESIVVEGNVKMDEEGAPDISDLMAEMSEDKKNVSFLDPSDTEPSQKCTFIARTGKNRGKACGLSVVDGVTRCRTHAGK